MIVLIAGECGVDARLAAENVHQLHTRQVVSATFDDSTDTWLLRTVSGDEIGAQAVVDTRQFHVPSIPNYPGRNEFGGPTFHSADWDAAFEPAGKRVAVIGDRAAHVVGLLRQSEVTLFDCPPTWETRKTKRRWVRRAHTQKAPARATSDVERITPAGIRIADGMDYEVDAIIYATGSTTRNGVPDDALVGPNGLTIQRAWQDGAEAFMGLAMYGFPNYFLLLGPDSPVGNREAVADRQVSYIAACLRWMKQQGSTRMEIRRSAQRQFTERGRVKPPALAFDLTSADAHREIYDGPAALTVAGHDHAVRVRLTGHLDPIDGKYHWQGTVFGATADFLTGSRLARITTGTRATQVRITEQTPWGSYSIAGVGAPPFELSQPT